MTIEVFGLGSVKTKRTLVNVEEAASEFDDGLAISWIDDIARMSKVGIIYTPTVLVIGKVKSLGRIPSVHEIKTWVEQEQVKEQTI